MTQTKDALDHKGSDPAVSGYSMAILWNLEAEEMNRAHAITGLPIPVDGDALARSSSRLNKNAAKWSALRADALALLRANAAQA